MFVFIFLSLKEIIHVKKACMKIFCCIWLKLCLLKSIYFDNVILVNQFNSTTTENGNKRENISLSKYYNKMHNIKIPHKNKFCYTFSINACTLNKNLMTFNIY